MMKTSLPAAVPVVAAFLLATLAGCAAGGAEEAEDAVKVDVAEGETNTTYVARVTYRDLRDANASCVGTTCRLGGTVWDCKGGGYCSSVK